MYVSWSMILLLSHLLMLLIFPKEMIQESFILEWEIETVSSLSPSFNIMVDWISIGFSSVVLLISSMVMSYSKEYMMGEKSTNRFIILVLLFVLSMILLIWSPNLFSIMIGWDGLGLVSFCLVIFYQNTYSLKSGLLTLYTNRLGDVALLIAFFYLMNTGDWSGKSSTMKTSMSMFIFLGAITKSAQIPFSAWLPAAMAAPTPVSSLVHSSTLVTAGVYIMIRFNSFFIVWSKIASTLSILTMITAGIIACFEKDFKKTIAMSTLSQLGVMMFALANNNWIFSYFHMMTHALFKSMMFLSCGNLISQNWGGQDIRSYGGFSQKTPLMSVFMTSGSLSLMGFPFMAGFFSKDFILENSSISSKLLNFWLFYFACILTSVYSLRVLELSLNKMSMSFSMTPLKENFFMKTPLIPLMVWSILGGQKMSNMIQMNNLMVFKSMKEFTGSIILLGLLLYIGMKTKKSKYLIQSFFMKMGFLPWLSTGFINKKITKIVPISNWEQTWSEVLGGQGIYLIMTKKKEISKSNFKTLGLIIFMSIYFFI